MVDPLWKIIWGLFKKLKMVSIYDLEMSLLDTHSKLIKMDLYSRVSHECSQQYQSKKVAQRSTDSRIGKSQEGHLHQRILLSPKRDGVLMQITVTSLSYPERKGATTLTCLCMIWRSCGPVVPS